VSNHTQKKPTTPQILEAMPQDKVQFSISVLGGQVRKGGGVIEMGVSTGVVENLALRPEKQILVLYVIDREAYEQTRERLQQQKGEERAS